MASTHIEYILAKRGAAPGSALAAWVARSTGRLAPKLTHHCPRTQDLENVEQYYRLARSPA